MGCIQSVEVKEPVIPNTEIILPLIDIDEITFYNLEIVHNNDLLYEN